jgi:hypothetical protein
MPAVTASGNSSATRESESSDGYWLSGESYPVVSKIRDRWCGALAIQKIAKTKDGPKSIQGTTARKVPRTSSAKVNGNRYVLYLNRNDAKRNLNLNNWANDWNDNWGFLGAPRSPISHSAFSAG